MDRSEGRKPGPQARMFAPRVAGKPGVASRRSVSTGRAYRPGYGPSASVTPVRRPARRTGTKAGRREQARREYGKQAEKNGHLEKEQQKTTYRINKRRYPFSLGGWIPPFLSSLSRICPSSLFWNFRISSVTRTLRLHISRNPQMAREAVLSVPSPFSFLKNFCKQVKNLPLYLLRFMTEQRR